MWTYQLVRLLIAYKSKEIPVELHEQEPDRLVDDITWRFVVMVIQHV